MSQDVPVFLMPFRWIGAAILSLFAEAGRLAAFTARVKFAAISFPFYPGELLRQCIKIGYYSLPVVGLTAVFTGAALALNIYVGGARFNAEQFVPNIVVLGITRELGPVLAALMLAGRVSAGIAAEIGTMKVTEQIDALTTLSTKPERYLYAPRFWAAIICLPILVFIADIIGVMGGYLVATGTLNFNGVTYIQNTMNYVTAGDIIGGLIKAATFGAVVSIMGCYHGQNSKGGASGVGRAATLAVVSSAVLIFFTNFLLTTVFTRVGL